MNPIVLLDGGLGQEIVKRSRQPAKPLWSLEVMLEDSDLVGDVHKDFVEAGARVVTLNTYSATPSRLTREGFSCTYEEICDVALDVARRAVAQANRPTGGAEIAGCLPPIVASYIAELAPDFRKALTEYRRLVARQAPHVDVFLIETMTNVTEARAAMTAANESGRPTYVGLTLSDDGSNTLRSGVPLAEALEDLIDTGPAGFILNCSYPEVISKAMPILRETGLPFGGYANGFTSVTDLKPGTTVDVLETRRDLGPAEYADFAMDWVAQGASIVGGCCGIGPDHIRALHQRLIETGHSPVGFAGLSATRKAA